MEVIRTKKATKYREKIYINGREHKSPSFLRKSDAKSWKARMVAERSNHQAFGRRLKERIKLSAYSEVFLQRIKDHLAEKTFSEYQSLLKNHINPCLGYIYLDVLDKEHGERFISVLRGKGKNAKGVNLALGLLKRILNYAVEDDYLYVNRLKLCKNLKEPPRPDVFLTDLEIRQLLAANLREPIYHLLVIALNTGLRRGELAGLKWDRVDFERNLLEITRTRDRSGLKETTKSHEKRIVPINSHCRMALTELLSKQASLTYIFTDKEGTPFDVHRTYRHFKRAQEKAGFSRFFRFHDLRHTFSSHFMMKGGNIFDLQKILGHTSIDMTQRYAHLSPGHLAKATELLGFQEELRPKVGQENLMRPESLMILEN